MATTGNVNENNRLVELKGSGYEIVKGEPDIRGWEVKDIQGRTFGKVDELLFDKESQKVRYIVLNLKGNLLNLKSRKVLIPIGLAQLDDRNDDVIFSEITAIHLTELPDYGKTPITYDHEIATRNIFAGLGAHGIDQVKSTTESSDGLGNDRSNFYQHEHFDENHFYEKRHRPSSEDTSSNNPSNKLATEGTKSIPIIEENLEVGKKEVETGETRIHSSITEKPVEENVKLQSEKVNIERNEVNRPASATDLKSFEEGTIEFTEKKEVPIVTKEAKVVEEISLSKEIEEHDATIKDTVRKTQVEIERDDKNEEDTKKV